ncbi:MAG: hypothetical protein QM518_02070 [Verrucomicrobiota bacterium]|nr:hypothetical protein [Verrucomicrobiota bacterium]
MKTQPSRFLPPTDAFILLEVLLGVAILASSLLALNAAIGQCIRSARAIDGYTLSEVLIDQIIWELDEQKEWLPGVLEGEFEGMEGFTWAQEIVESEYEEEEGLFRRIIQVQWQDRGGSVTEQVETFIYRSPEELEEMDFAR